MRFAILALIGMISLNCSQALSYQTFFMQTAFEQGKSASSPHCGRVYAIMESLAATARPQRPNFGKEAGEKSRLETGVGRAVCTKYRYYFKYQNGIWVVYPLHGVYYALCSLICP